MKSGIVCWGILCLSATTVWAQAPAATAPLKPPFELPAVFLKPAPSNVEELREFEKHLERILPVLKAATVNLRVGNAQGSGVIVNPDGLVLTAAHVSGNPGSRVSILSEDSQAQVQAPPFGRGRRGGRSTAGVTLGRDKTQDASMVRIESERKDWPWCPIAKVDAEPGDWCIVLGHPGGLDRERGIVVRVGRVISRRRDSIQTDCELIGGDSGGPLFNMKGEVIGINSRIADRLDFNLHVPISAYSQNWERLANSEDLATHTGAYLGVRGIANPDGKGLLIQEVFRRSGAQEAGVRVGDILLSVAGKEVTNQEQLRELIGQHQVYRTVEIKLRRGEEEFTLQPRLSETP